MYDEDYKLQNFLFKYFCLETRSEEDGDKEAKPKITAKDLQNSGNGGNRNGNRSDYSDDNDDDDDFGDSDNESINYKQLWNDYVKLQLHLRRHVKLPINRLKYEGLLSLHRDEICKLPHFCPSPDDEPNQLFQRLQQITLFFDKYDTSDHALEQYFVEFFSFFVFLIVVIMSVNNKRECTSLTGHVHLFVFVFIFILNSAR